MDNITNRNASYKNISTNCLQNVQTTFNVSEHHYRCRFCKKESGQKSCKNGPVLTCYELHTQYRIYIDL